MYFRCVGDADCERTGKGKREVHLTFTSPVRSIRFVFTFNMCFYGRHVNGKNAFCMVVARCNFTYWKLFASPFFALPFGFDSRSTQKADAPYHVHRAALGTIDEISACTFSMGISLGQTLQKQSLSNRNFAICGTPYWPTLPISPQPSYCLENRWSLWSRRVREVQEIVFGLQLQLCVFKCFSTRISSESTGNLWLCKYKLCL